MNVLILSIDKTLAGGEGVGDAVERHKHYGKFLDRLDIIVYANKKDKLGEFKISGNVCGYPSNSYNKAFFIFDCLKIFKRINRDHKVDLIVCQDPFIIGLAGWWLKKKYSVKLEINFHGDHWENPYWLRERWINYIFLIVSKFIVPRADAIRVVSKFIRRKLIKRGVEEAKIRVIPTPVDLAKFAKFSQDEVNKTRSKFNNKKNILFVGRLAEVKNFPLLISSFAKVKDEYPNVNLLVIGDGPERRQIEKLVNDFNLTSNVFLLGPIKSGQLPNYYQASDILVLSSFSEGMPKVLVEGGVCGLPMVSTKVSGAEEIIRDSWNGFLVPVGDQEKLTERILRLLKDELLRIKMGENSKKIVENNFRDTTPKLIKFWQDIINNKL